MKTIFNGGEYLFVGRANQSRRGTHRNVPILPSVPDLLPPLTAVSERALRRRAAANPRQTPRDGGALSRLLEGSSVFIFDLPVCFVSFADKAHWYPGAFSGFRPDSLQRRTRMDEVAWPLLGKKFGGRGFWRRRDPVLFPQSLPSAVRPVFGRKTATRVLREW